METDTALALMTQPFVARVNKMLNRYDYKCVPSSRGLVIFLAVLLTFQRRNVGQN